MSPDLNELIRHKIDDAIRSGMSSDVFNKTYVSDQKAYNRYFNVRKKLIRSRPKVKNTSTVYHKYTTYFGVRDRLGKYNTYIYGIDYGK